MSFAGEGDQKSEIRASIAASGLEQGFKYILSKLVISGYCNDPDRMDQAMRKKDIYEFAAAKIEEFGKLWEHDPAVDVYFEKPKVKVPKIDLAKYTKKPKTPPKDDDPWGTFKVKPKKKKGSKKKEVKAKETEGKDDEREGGDGNSSGESGDEKVEQEAEEGADKDEGGMATAKGGLFDYNNLPDVPTFTMTGRNLPIKNSGGECDPLVVVYAKDDEEKYTQLVTRTEPLSNTTEPEFGKKLALPKGGTLQFAVMDIYSDKKVGDHNITCVSIVDMSSVLKDMESNGVALYQVQLQDLKGNPANNGAALLELTLTL